MRKTLTAILAALFPLFSIACSLNYGSDDISEAVVPEILSENVVFTRVENGNTTFRVTADKIEQYKDASVSYAQNVSFKSYNGDGTLNSEGSCNLLSADSDSEEYFLLDNITIQNYSKNLKIIAKNLHWNGKTEQLTGVKNEQITIQKDNVTLSGTGFAASAVSNTFKFSGDIEGSITSKENTEPDENLTGNDAAIRMEEQ